jgi:hypothetical protein
MPCCITFAHIYVHVEPAKLFYELKVGIYFSADISEISPKPVILVTTNKFFHRTKFSGTHIIFSNWWILINFGWIYRAIWQISDNIMTGISKNRSPVFFSYREKKNLAESKVLVCLAVHYQMTQYNNIFPIRSDATLQIKICYYWSNVSWPFICCHKQLIYSPRHILSLIFIQKWNIFQIFL